LHNAIKATPTLTKKDHQQFVPVLVDHRPDHIIILPGCKLNGIYNFTDYFNFPLLK